MEELKKTDKLTEILNMEDELLNQILSNQDYIRRAVKSKDWVRLEESIENVKTGSSEFVVLDEKREKVSGEYQKLNQEQKALEASLRQKLLKFKVENRALNEYLEVTSSFIQNVLENIVPQRRNMVYGRNGKMVKSAPESVVLNTVM